MIPDAICGHDRETLRWALNQREQTEQFSVSDIPAPSGGKGAFEVICDPAKLAAIIAELLRERGIAQHYDPNMPAWAIDVEADQLQPNKPIYVSAYEPDKTGPIPRMRWLTMPQARAFALALLDIAKDKSCRNCTSDPTSCGLIRATSVQRCCPRCTHVATAQDIERMIGETTR